MTDALLSHIYLETGEKLGFVLIDLRKLDEIHQNWLDDLANCFKEEEALRGFAFDLKDIRNLEGNFLDGDYYLVLHGLRQLQLAYYRKKHHFEDTKAAEDSLYCDLNSALSTFYLHADDVFEAKMSRLANDKRESFFDKLRQWSIYRRIYADTTNEISTLICHDATLDSRPVLLELSLAHQVIAQAKYQIKYGYDQLEEDEKLLLKAFVENPLLNELESWKI